MSNSVDQRIVEMQFDNASFERGIASTMASLSNLESILSKTGLGKIGDALSNVDFSTPESRISSIGALLQSVGDVGAGAFEKISNAMATVSKIGAGVFAVLNTGIAGISIQSGWKRASDLADAKFKLQQLGSSWEEVGDIVQKSVDDTAYGLGEAAIAAATLGASGVTAQNGLKETLQATANLASVSGIEYGRVAQLLGQIASQGKLGGMQLESFSLAGINLVGILAREWGTTEDVIRDMIKKGTIDLSTFVTAMNNQLGEGAKDAQNTFTGSFANLKSALGRTTADFFGEFQTSMVPIFGSLRQVVNEFNKALIPIMRIASDGEKGVLLRGFRDITEQIAKAIDDWVKISSGPEQLQKFFQGLADGMEGFFSAVSAGAYDFTYSLIDIIGIIRELARLFSEVVSPIFMALNDVFGGTEFKDAMKTTREGLDGVLDALNHAHVSTGYIKVMRTVFGAFFRLVSIAGKAAFAILGAGFTLITKVVEIAAKAFFGFFDVVDMVASAIGNFFGTQVLEFFEAIANFISGLPGLSALGDFLGGLPGAISELVNSMRDAADPFAVLQSFFDKVEEMGGPVFSEVAQGLGAMAVSVGKFVSGLKNATMKKAVVIFGRIGDVLGRVWKKVVPVLESVRDRLASLWSVIKEAVASSGLSFDPIANAFSRFGDAFSAFIDNVLDNGLSFESIGTLISGLKDAIVPAMEEISESVGFIASSIGDEIYNSMSPAIQKLWDLLSGFGIEDLFSGLKNVDVFGSLGSILSKQVSDIASIDLTSIGDIATDVKNAISHPFTTASKTLKDISNDFGKAFDTVVSSIDSEKLNQLVAGIGKLAALAGIAATFYEVMKVLDAASKMLESAGNVLKSFGEIAKTINTVIKSLGKATAMKIRTTAIKDVAISIAIIVGAFIALSFSDLDKVYAAVPLMLGIVAGIVALVIAMNKIPMTTVAEVKALTNVTTSMFALALVIGAVAFAVHSMRGMSAGEIVNASVILLSVGFLIRSMSALSKESKGKVSGGGLATLGKNVLQAAIGVLAIVAAVKILGDMDPAALKQGGDALGSIAVLVGALMAFAAWSNKGGGLTKSAPAIIAFCGSLAILAVALRLLATAPFDALMGGVLALGLLMGALTLFIFVMDSINPVILVQDAAALVVMAAAVLILAGAVAGLAVVSSMGGDIVTGALAVALLVAILGAGLYIMSSAAAQMTVTASAILWFAAAVAILAAVVVVFTLMGDDLWAGIGKMAAALAIMVVAFAIVAVVAEICKVGLVAITLFVVGVGVSALLLAVALKIMVDALVEMANIAPEAADQFIEALNRLALGLWESKENIALGIAALGSGIIAGIIVIIPAACEALILLVAKLIETLVRLAPALAMGAMELATGFFNGMAVAIREQGPALIDAIINLFTAIADLAVKALADGVVSFSNWLYEVTSGAMGTAPRAEEAGEAIGTAMVDGTDSGMSKLPDVVSSNAAAAVDKLAEVYPQLETAGSRSGDSFVSGWTNSAFSTFSTNLNSALENAGLNSILPAEWAGKTSADAYSSGFASGDMSQAAQEMLSKVGFDMNALSSQMGFDSFESYAGGFNESASSVQISDALMEEIDSGDMTAKFEQAGVDAATGFNDGFHGSLQSGDGGFIGETVASLNQPDMFTQAGMTDGVAVTNGLRTGLFQAAGNARTALNSVSSAVSSYSGTMGSSGRWIGYNVSAGISRGIDEGAWMAIARARALAERVTRTIKDALETKSPSRVMIEIGEYVSEGLAIGISNVANMPVMAAENMARNTISALSEQVSMIEAMAEDISADPVIRPVLDLSDYNAGLSAMGALDASPAFAASGWTSGIRTPYDLRTPISSRNTSNTIQVTLDWKAGTTPNQVVQELAEELGAYYAMEG